MPCSVLPRLLSPDVCARCAAEQIRYLTACTRLRTLELDHLAGTAEAPGSRVHDPFDQHSGRFAAAVCRYGSGALVAILEPCILLALIGLRC